MPTKEENKELFRAKNEARKLHYSGTGTHKAARIARRAYRGTFGNSESQIWNHMIQGTGGVERHSSNKGE